MTRTQKEKAARGWIARHWGMVTATALALSGFLGWYDGVRKATVSLTPTPSQREYRGRHCHSAQ